MKIIGIIPARGGSKGIPQKNIIDVCGHPLISYSIKLGNKLVENKIIHRCIVSTDCKEISAISLNYGGDVPFLRPRSIAGDRSKSIEYIIHAIDFLDEDYDAVLILQPTSPLRKVHDVKKAIELINKKNIDSVISCYKEEYISEYVAYELLTDKILQPKNINHNKGVARQEIKSSFIRNGAIYLTKMSYFRKTSQIISDNPGLIEMKKKYSIDVDTFDDLDLLRAFISYENWNTREQ